MKSRHLLASCAVLACLAIAVRLPAEDTKPISIAGLTFTPGNAWTSKTPSSSMRAAELEVKPADGADGLIAVFYFFGPGQGGSAEDNIERWLGQFDGEPEHSTKEHAVGDKKVVILDAKGTYLESEGGPFGPKTPREGYTLLGAVVPAGDGNVFIKLAGKSDAVAAIKDEFVALSTSPFAEKK